MERGAPGPAWANREVIPQAILLRSVGAHGRHRTLKDHFGGADHVGREERAAHGKEGEPDPPPHVRQGGGVNHRERVAEEIDDADQGQPGLGEDRDPDVGERAPAFRLLRAHPQEADLAPGAEGPEDAPVVESTPVAPVGPRADACGITRRRHGAIHGSWIRGALGPREEPYRRGVDVGREVGDRRDPVGDPEAEDRGRRPSPPAPSSRSCASALRPESAARSGRWRPGARPHGDDG